MENGIRDKRKKWINKDTDVLFEAILRLRNLSEAQRFFRDLLTEKEIIEFGQRWKAARMLNKRTSYIKIGKETGLSSTTIARVHQWLKKGRGGYKLMLKRMNNRAASNAVSPRRLRSCGYSPAKIFGLPT